VHRAILRAMPNCRRTLVPGSRWFFAVNAFPANGDDAVCDVEILPWRRIRLSPVLVEAG
jgi:hypothetical protein